MNIRKVLNPPPEENFLLGDSVAVVGNSGALVGSELGGEIDDHESVIRFNAAPVEGWEEDVGSKTSLRVLNAITQKGSTCNGTDQIGLDRLRTVVEGDRLICKRSSSEVYDIARDNYSDVAKWLAVLGAKGYTLVRRELQSAVGHRRARSKRLSLGALMAVLASTMSDTVRLYGFGFHEEDLPDIHYWESVEKDITAHHDYGFEKEVIETLDRNGDLDRVRH
jgi:Glycosyltransferase family 29 (sialyltransferase).